jgi:hypothetical protein
MVPAVTPGPLTRVGETPLVVCDWPLARDVVVDASTAVAVVAAELEPGDSDPDAPASGPADDPAGAAPSPSATEAAAGAPPDAEVNGTVVPQAESASAHNTGAAIRRDITGCLLLPAR